MLPPAFRRADRPVVLGHRGASADRPENTLEAFELAVRQGADGIELDVMRCQTGELVVVHDPSLERLAGRPLEVRRTPWSVLRALDVGSHFDHAYRSARLPLLPEVLAALPRTALINIELKGDRRLPDLGLAPAVASALEQALEPERFLVSSFDPVLLAGFRLAAPARPCAWLFAESQTLAQARWALAGLLGAVAVHPSVALCSAQALRRWKRAGFGVNAWTVDSPAVALALRAGGVDGLISNRPAALLTSWAETSAGA